MTALYMKFNHPYTQNFSLSDAHKFTTPSFGAFFFGQELVFRYFLPWCKFFAMLT